MPQTLITNFFFPSTIILSNGKGSVLSKPCPPAVQNNESYLEILEQVLTILGRCSPVYFGTVTLDPQKHGMHDRAGQENILKSAMREFINTQPQCIYIWAIEYHKDFRPHIHLLSTNYIKNFKNCFKSCGSRNLHKTSYQETKNIRSVYEYITKLCPQAQRMYIEKKFYIHFHETLYESYNPKHYSDSN